MTADGSPLRLSLLPWPPSAPERILQLWAWLIGEPSPVRLNGQCCDRLRPRFVRLALEQVLPLHAGPDAQLVDWRWDSRMGRVQGLVLHNSQLKPFRWWPHRDHFELRAAILGIRAIGWHRR